MHPSRDAFLVRSDLRPPAFHLSDVHSRVFDATFSFAGLTIFAGWITADVHMGNERFRFVTTHLQSPIAGVPEATDVQVAQTEQLIRELRRPPVPVLLCGDFNSDANRVGPVDATPTVDLIEKAGYEEAWPLTHAAGDLGFTWPLYLEDQFPPSPFVVASTPFERIDLFFSRGLEVLGSELVGSTPPFGSDHAGAIAVFRP